MMGVMEAFSTTYAQSRLKFLEAAATVGLQFESSNSLEPSKDSGILALDAAFQQTTSNAVFEKLLIISSASKTADSFGGSGAQVFVLHDAEWMEKVRAAGVSVLYLHGSDQSLADVVKKHVSAVKKVVLVDVSADNSLKNTIFETLYASKLAEKCKFVEVKSIAVDAPAWQGQTISRARQALFSAVDSFDNH
jgi:Protein of unknown function (DUF2817)